ncbi:hypothetical protein ACOSQ3_015973 [Xanthoceras sorbifolium]
MCLLKHWCSNNSFGVIIRVESEVFQVLKGVPDKNKNNVSVKDIVKILEGPCKGKQGPVEHIERNSSMTTIILSMLALYVLKLVLALLWEDRVPTGMVEGIEVEECLQKICQGPYKRFKGLVVGGEGQLVRIELQAKTQVVTVHRSIVSDHLTVSTPYSDTPRYGIGSETLCILHELLCIHI